jgi:hypothetical protein
MADQLENVIAKGEPEQAKALLRVPIAELRVNGKTDIQPTYRIVAPGVCATSEKVGRSPGIRCPRSSIFGGVHPRRLPRRRARGPREGSRGIPSGLALR